MADDNKKNDNDKIKKKLPMLIFYVVAIVLIFAVPFVINPMLQQDEEVEEVSYSAFLDYVEEGKVEKATIWDSKIDFEVNSNNETKTYTTARAEDNLLVDRLYENNVEIVREYAKATNPIVSIIFQMLSTLLFMLVLWLFLSKVVFKQMGDGGVGPMSFGKSNAKIYVESTDGITFANVAGQDEAKEQLTEIVDFLHNPKRYSRIGAKLPKGALLVGPPGTGKTLLAKAVAGEAKVPFFSISGSEFVEMFVGLGAAKVRDLFKQAHEKAPCIVFIDEIDTIGKKRDGAGFSGNDEREQTLNQLLSEMDGFEGNDGVVILAATNRPDSLDPALLRPGRFDRRVPVELPDVVGREAILKVHAEKIKKDSNIDYNAVARSTSGASGADLANMINEAALRAVREGRDIMTQRDIEESVEVVLAGQEKKNMVISQREKEMIAYHEVGHAIVAAKQTNSAPVHKITIIPRTSGALGYTMQVDEEEKYLMSREDLFNKIVTLTGGRSAEELIFSVKTTGASNDIEQATKLARAMITRYGMSDEFGFVAMETVNNAYLGGDTTLTVSPETVQRIDKEVQRIIEQAHEKAIKIIIENINAVHDITNYLLQKETITGEEFMQILRRHEEDSLEQKVVEEIEGIQIAQEVEDTNEVNEVEDTKE